MSLSYYSSCSKGIQSHNNKMKYTLGFLPNMPIICSDICPIYIYYVRPHVFHFTSVFFVP